MKDDVLRQMLAFKTPKLSNRFLKAGQHSTRIDLIMLPTWVVRPSYLANTECMLTWGIIFFSTESWNRGGGGRSTARNKKGDTIDLISNGELVWGFGWLKAAHTLPRSISKRGFSFSPESGRTRTCWVSTRSSPWNVEKIIPGKVLSKWWQVWYHAYLNSSSCCRPCLYADDSATILRTPLGLLVALTENFQHSLGSLLEETRGDWLDSWIIVDSTIFWPARRIAWAIRVLSPENWRAKGSPAMVGYAKESVWWRSYGHFFWCYWAPHSQADRPLTLSHMKVLRDEQAWTAS